MKKIILSALLFLGVVGFASAQSSSTPRFALVIGNQTYAESPLKNPVADAKLMRDALNECGFDVTFATDLDIKGLQTVIADYAEKVASASDGKNTISFFYYSGHGVQIQGKNYMVPIDNKGITSEIKAKGICYSIDDVFSLVPSNTQVVVLDACRNNPFSSTKVQFQKGLTRIEKPKNVSNFMAFFSTGDGATADDGSGKNSLFTEKLASHIQLDFNTPVSTVFNTVASEVKDATNGKQQPLVSGTGVNFELMNAEVAAARIKSLSSKIKTGAANQSNSKEYDSDKKLAEADIAMLEKRKADAEKDAKAKAEQKKKVAATQQKNQKEMERMQKEAATQQKEYQAQKAKEKSCLQFIGEIEDNKEALQKTRQTTADKIYAANLVTQKSSNAKIDEINNAPLKATEKDAKGEMNSVTKKKRKDAVKVVEDENKVEKQKNFDTYYEKIAEEETDRTTRLDADIKTLKGAVYTASSFLNEVKFTVSNYDGAKNQWIITVVSNMLGRQDLFYFQIPVTYEQLCNVVLEQKYVDPKKMDSDSFEQYSDNIDTYDGAFKSSNPPLLIEVDYKVSPSLTGASTYDISAQSVRVKYMDTKKDNPLLNEKASIQSQKFVWDKKQTELKSVEDIVKAYEKRDAAEERAKQRASKPAIEHFFN